MKARARSDGPGATQLWQELHAQGLPGCASNFRRWFARRYPQLGRRTSPAPPPRAHHPHPRLLSALLLGIVRSPRPEDETYLARLCSAAPELDT
ncbi:MAG TPA: ISL3 family transposase, partial [Terriglobales bacterium]|nr:ISL3 family transposase [Terriglobales bacterium]